MESETRPYKKLKCVFCGYEMASKAITPKCSQCGSRRFNDIEQFSVVKPYTMKKLNEGNNMADEKTEAKKQAKAAKNEDNNNNDNDADDVDNDIWG